MKRLPAYGFLIGLFLLSACSNDDSYNDAPDNDDTQTDNGDSGDTTDESVDLVLYFGSNIDLDNLSNYANQEIPAYIDLDQTGPDYITDAGATLGRVLFYDKNLSTNNTISCASCHIQSRAFSDIAIASAGVNGSTGRHSMRLINTRFSNETRFFWDERASSLEDQSTQPIRDHNEMGFSGLDGAPNFEDLLLKMADLEYYPLLFTAAFGDELITETRMQSALGQFISSIQSFDSRYDTGRAVAPNDGAPFANFSPQENQGKQLFLAPPVFNATGVRIDGGVGCAGCHSPATFSIGPLSLNNGVIGVIGDSGASDFINTRSPSLRDLANNGPFFHDGSASNLEAVIAHYNTGIELNPNLDPRLSPGGNPQRLNLTDVEIDALVAFLETLSGSAVYTDPKWADPFL